MLRQVLMMTRVVQAIVRIKKMLKVKLDGILSLPLQLL